MGSLKLIEMENFKSFVGKCVVGPLGNFSSIIGPNGSGKSNIMDAISFALGENYSKLRVNNLTDLIYRGAARKPVSGSASVTLHIELDDESVVKFTRIIRENLTKYKINGNVVGLKEYLSQLAGLKIDSKAKHFLVYQGTIENIATMNAKTRTEFFEQISGSIKHKSDYDRYLRESNEAKKDYLFTFGKRKKLSLEKSKMMQIEKEAINGDKQLKQLKPLKIRYILLNLWKCETLYDETSEKLNEFHREVQDLKNRREEVYVEIKETKNLQSQFEREHDKEQFIKIKEKELNKTKAKYLSSQGAAMQTREMFERHKKIFQKAKKAQDEQQMIVTDLETQRRVFDNEIKDLKVKIQEFEESQEFHLSSEQVAEYNQLKARADNATIQNVRKRNECKEKQRELTNELANKNRQQIEIESRIKIKQDQISSNVKRIENIDKNIKNIENRIESLSKSKRRKREEHASLESRVDIEKELVDIGSKITNLKNNKEANSGYKKKENVLQQLKSTFPGVKGRLRNLFKPTDEKYNIAVGKSTRSCHNSIVVDTQKTAKECIEFLDHNKLGVENFLPMDSVVAKEKPIPPRIDPSVKRLFDVVKFAPELKRVMWLATNNTLVCETSDEICQVARLTNHDVIALDGTSCLKNGIVSGGKANLENKWKEWNYKPYQLQDSMDDLNRRKDELTAQLAKVVEYELDNFSLTSLENDISALEKRMTLADSQKISYQEQNEIFDKEKESFEEQKQKIQDDIKILEKSFDIEERMIKSEESLIIETVDRIFLDFCQRNNLENIRQYEKEVSRVDKEQKTILSKAENQLSSIDYNLGLERKRLLQRKEIVCHYQKVLKDHESQLAEHLKTEETEKEDLDSLEAEMKDLTKKREERKSKFQVYSNHLRKLGKKLVEVNQEIHFRQNKITDLQQDLIESRNERHEILTLCKIEDLGIKLHYGSLDNIESESSEESRVLSDGSSTEDSITNGEWKHKVNYGQFEIKFRQMNKDDLNLAIIKTDKVIKKLEDQLKDIKGTSLKFKEKLKNLKLEYCKLDQELTGVKAKVNQTKRLFVMAKNKRHEKFMRTFNHLRNVIGEIYKELTNERRADAMLVPSNEEEPYLGDIRYDCLLPGKNFRDMSSLSGGERSLASLAILLALRSYQESPFLVLDEIDTSLDQFNVGKVVNYFQSRTAKFQLIVISHKNRFYRLADTLLGIRSQLGQNISNQVISLNLSEFLDD